MRPCIACLLAVTIAAGLTATVAADDGDTQPSRRIFPIFRPRTKPTATVPTAAAPATPAPVTVALAANSPANATPAAQMMILNVVAEPMLAPPPANAPAVAAPMVAPPATGTPCFNISDPDAGYPAVPVYQAPINQRSRLRQRETDCLGCYSCLGYWRFFCGGCGAFWREGRHEPDFVNGCYCGSR